jgi:uncharacterized caspase-like protein
MRSLFTTGSKPLSNPPTSTRRARADRRSVLACGWSDAQLTRSLVLYCAALLLWPSLGFAATRALVIGTDYHSGRADLALENTLVDSRNVAQTLRRIRAAEVRTLENPGFEEWRAAISEFAETLTADDVAVIYYAGHAVQIEGENYFIAADGESLVSAEEVLSLVMARARGTLFVVDACRNNPFNASTQIVERLVRVRSLSQTESRGFQAVRRLELESRGLSQMNNVRGRNAIVFFSTEPGNVAVDGEAGRGSPFANAFVREITRRQSLDAAIRRITTHVIDATNGQQSPWRQGDLAFALFLAGQPRFPVP